MAKARRTTGKRKKKVKKDAYVQAIIVIIFSLVLAVLIYGRTGTFGEGLSKVLGGLVGWIKFIVPIGIFIVGIVLTKEQKEFVIPKLIQFLIIVLAICGTMSLGQISNEALNANEDFGEIIYDAYGYGETNKGGGAVGALIAVPLSKTIGAASYVVLIGTAILLSIFTFGIRPAELVDKMSQMMQASNEYEEDDEEEEEIKPRKKARTREREKPKKQHSVIMENLFDDDDDEPRNKKKYEHDIPLAFEEKESTESVKVEKIKEKAKAKEEVKPVEEDFIEANLFKEKKEEKEEKTKQELQLEHSQVEVDENYEFPPIALLEQGEGRKLVSKTALTDNALKLQKTLHSFGVNAKVEDVAVRTCNYKIRTKTSRGS